jgi:hypothetical protein
MSEKLGFCLVLVRVQGGIEDRLKVGGGRRGGGSVELSLGHDSTRELRRREDTGGWEKERHCSLVFCRTDGDRYGTTPVDSL